MKKLNILIPTYKQHLLLKRCLRYLSRQSFKDFLITIKDDSSGISYEDLKKEFPDLEIIFIYNQNNLGAIKNMISCLTLPPKSEFIMCLHEDDFIHQNYLSVAINILEKNKSIAFVASPAFYFEPENAPNESFPQLNTNSDYEIFTKIKFTEFILNKSNNFAFGSIIYRANVVDPGSIDLESYGVFFDRPFLIRILENNNYRAAILKAPFYYYQNHPYPDNRWKTLTKKNITNLYSFYEKIAPQCGLFITSQYIFDFVNLKNKKWFDIFNFIKEGRKNNLINLRRISWKFTLASLFILIFGKKYYYALFKLIKRL